MTRNELLKRIEQAVRNGATGLFLSRMGIKELPPEIGQLTNLTTLHLSNNQLTMLPPEICQLTSLTTLLLYDNQLSSLPPEIGQLTNLTTLHLSNNQLTMLPPEIGKLSSLTELYLFDNQLKTLPAEIGKLTSLTELYLFDNQLKTLPREIGLLTNLTTLHLSDNQLTTLPPDIGQFTSLKNLYLNENQLTTLPPEIEQLTSLRSLHLSENQLTTLPTEIGELKALEEIGLDKLELTDPPPDIIAQGTRAILAYLREQKLKDTRIWESRLMVVGEGGVGKTQLLTALNGKDFQVESESTHGIDVIPLKLKHPVEDDITMTLNAWDFGGQDIYHATHQFFLASRSLFVLCWNSRLGWEQGKLHYWLDTIDALAPEAFIMLVATHIDERETTLPFENLQQKYPQIIGKWSVSNDQRELGDGIEGLKNALRNFAADKDILPLMGKTTPASFWDTTQAIRKLRKSEKWITADRLEEIMVKQKVSEAARPVLAKQLHDLGELIHFRDDPNLKDTVLLDARFVTKTISDVLEYEGIEDGLGIFTRQHMEECWSDLDERLRNRFLHLMERFDLSYKIPDDAHDQSLVVERLAHDPVPYEAKWNTMQPKAGFREIRMKFDPQSTRPAGIPGWFIARSHRFTTHTHWKYGALFQDNRKQPRHLALLESSSQFRHVELSVRGPNPQAFFSVLRDGLELTFDRFPGLELLRTMPCPGHDRKDASKPCEHEFDVADLESRMQFDPPKFEIECPKCYQDVSVTEMLFGLHWTTDSQVLQRLDELDRNADKRTRQILEELGDLRELWQRQFLTLFNAAQRLEESHCPRVFSLRPEQGKNWPVFDKLLVTKWQLQLYCEAPGCWHPAEQGNKKGKYTIPEPSYWLNTIAPWVKRLITVFKYSAHFANPVLGYSAAALGTVLKSDINLMKALVDKLPEVRVDRNLKTEYGLEEGDKSRVDGEMLRRMRHLLIELDPKQEWGGLVKTLTPEGHWLWLCDEHAQEYRQ